MIKFILIILILASFKSFCQYTPTVRIKVRNDRNDTVECENRTFTLYAESQHGGTAPTYQWRKNGTVINNYNYIVYPGSSKTLVEGDVISCTMISNDDSAYPATATATYTIRYNRLHFPISLFATPSGTIMPNTDVKFTAIIKKTFFNAPYCYYSIYINGIQDPRFSGPPPYGSGGNYSGDSIFYSNRILKNGDSIYITRQANFRGNPCGYADTSNIITMSVKPVLPVTLSYFNVKSTRKVFTLSWATTKENNINNFDIQASTDGFLFKSVGLVKPKGINQPYTFTYVPPQSSDKTYYLQLKMIEKDGGITYSSIEKADLFGFSKIDSVEVKKRQNEFSKMDLYIDSTIRLSTSISNEYTNYSSEYHLRLLRDSTINTLTEKYLDLFDNVYQTDNYLLDKETKFISSPIQKIKFLTTYCLLSNIIPTRITIKACLKQNPCLLFQDSLPLNFKIATPLNFKIKRKSIKKIMTEYYKQEDSVDNVSKNNRIDENGFENVFEKSSFKTASVHFYNFDFPLDHNKWKIVFCIRDTNDQKVDSLFTLYYHAYKSTDRYHLAGEASLAGGELPPGYVYLEVFKKHTNIAVPIQNPEFLIKNEVGNYILDAYKRIITYQKNKGLSRENTYVIFIDLLKKSIW